ncbi:MAG: heme exporter protein CcmB [Kofleriaceae bacterium]
MLRQAARIAWKDLRIELRSREIIYTMTFFGGLLAVVNSFVFPSKSELIPFAVPGMLWVSMAFAGTIGLGRAFDRERENDTMRALLLAPIPRLSVFLGKAIAIALLMLAVALVVAPMLSLLLEANLFGDPLPFLLSLLLGAIGFAITGSVFSAALIKVRSRDVLLPVILYPLLIPLFVAGTSVTAGLLAGNHEKVWYWMGFLGIYDAAFLVVSLWIFEAMVIE